MARGRISKAQGHQPARVEGSGDMRGLRWSSGAVLVAPLFDTAYVGCCSWYIMHELELPVRHLVC
jgi:hypothetical protein